MYVTLIKSMDYVVNILVVLFIMKLVIDPREFFFNSALRPIDSITDPILTRMRKYLKLNRYGKDYVPLIAIIIIIIIYALVHWLIPVYHREFIKIGSSNLTIIEALAESMGKLLMFLIRFMAFSIFVMAMIPVYSKNPISSFFQNIVSPFGNLFTKDAKNSKNKMMLPTASIVVFLLGLLLILILNALVAPSFNSYITSWKTWIQPVFSIILGALSIYRFLVFLLIVSVILSWLDAEIRNSFVNLVYMLTEPMLLPIRRIVTPVGGLDLSPWLASLIIWFTGQILTKIIVYLNQLIVK